MSSNDRVEFHFPGGRDLVIQSSHAPNRGEMVNIKGQTYRVIGRTYTVDYSDQPQFAQMVCIVSLGQPLQKTRFRVIGG